MRLRAPLLAAATALVLSLSGCSGDDASDDVATDPAGSPATSAAQAPAPAVPTPAGPVRTAQGLVTVIDSGKGDGPQVCLGPIAEIYPPMCGGPAVTGWSWDGTGRGMHEEQGGVVWGSYALTGTWDGTAFAPTAAIPAALYDAAPATPTDPPTPTSTMSDAELRDVATRLQEELGDDVIGASAVQGQVLVDVYYDDGTLQDWADATWGAGVVVLSPAFVDA